MTTTLSKTADATFDRDIAGRTSLVLFTAAWCPPCRAIKPSLESLAAERTDVAFFTLDVDEHQQVAQRYGIRSLPTLLVFRNGVPAGQLVGAAPRTTIATLLSKLAGSAQAGHTPASDGSRAVAATSALR